MQEEKAEDTWKIHGSAWQDRAREIFSEIRKSMSVGPIL
jgi:hypothetical protein